MIVSPFISLLLSIPIGQDRSSSVSLPKRQALLYVVVGRSVSSESDQKLSPDARVERLLKKGWTKVNVKGAGVYVDPAVLKSNEMQALEKVLGQMSWTPAVHYLSASDFAPELQRAVSTVVGKSPFARQLTSNPMAGNVRVGSCSSLLVTLNIEGKEVRLYDIDPNMLPQPAPPISSEKPLTIPKQDETLIFESFGFSLQPDELDRVRLDALKEIGRLRKLAREELAKRIDGIGRKNWDGDQSQTNPKQFSQLSPTVQKALFRQLENNWRAYGFSSAAGAVQAVQSASVGKIEYRPTLLIVDGQEKVTAFGIANSL